MSEESGSGDSNGRSSPTQSDPQIGGAPASSPENSQCNKQQAYIKQLLAEKQMLEEKMGTSGGVDLQLTHKLLLNELERLQSGGKPQHGSGRAPTEERRFADIIKEKPIKVTIRVLVPVKEHPKFNFVGKLLGPKGNSLKRLQEDTMTKMAILGRGSMRDKHKEEELRASSDPKYAHFNDDLHVEITAFAPPAEAHARIAYALAEVRKFLVPDYNDEIRQEQMREMQLLNTSLLGLASPGGTEVVGTSPVAQSPNTSPPPTSGASATLLQAASKPGGGSTTAGHQNGRHIQAVQNGRPGSYVYNQQLLLHPAFRGLTARAHGIQLPGAASVYHAGAGSILSRLRHQQHQHNIAAAAAAARISPGAGVVPSVKHQRNSILSILAGGPRSIIGGGALDGSGSEQLLTSMSAEDMMVAADDDGGPTATVAAPGPNTVYGLYENYAAAAAAAAASGTGYGLIEGYANGNGVLTAESMEDLAVGQDAVNGSAAVAAAVELAGRSEAAGAVKMDRSRYRHDPYVRYTPAGPSGVKLPL